MILIPLVLSLTIHEWAHAWSAHRLGDDTAKMQGRLTLNPVSHIDLVGTLLLPLLGIPFGWAKPVPVNPTRFRRGVKMSTGMVPTQSSPALASLGEQARPKSMRVARPSPSTMTLAGFTSR